MTLNHGDFCDPGENREWMNQVVNLWVLFETRMQRASWFQHSWQFSPVLSLNRAWLYRAPGLLGNSTFLEGFQQTFHREKWRLFLFKLCHVVTCCRRARPGPGILYNRRNVRVCYNPFTILTRAFLYANTLEVELEIVIAIWWPDH